MDTIPYRSRYVRSSLQLLSLSAAVALTLGAERSEAQSTQPLAPTATCGFAVDAPASSSPAPEFHVVLEPDAQTTQAPIRPKSSWIGGCLIKIAVRRAIWTTADELYLSTQFLNELRDPIEIENGAGTPETFKVSAPHKVTDDWIVFNVAWQGDQRKKPVLVFNLWQQRPAPLSPAETTRLEGREKALKAIADAGAALRVMVNGIAEIESQLKTLTEHDKEAEKRLAVADERVKTLAANPNPEAVTLLKEFIGEAAKIRILLAESTRCRQELTETLKARRAAHDKQLREYEITLGDLTVPGRELEELDKRLRPKGSPHLALLKVGALPLSPNTRSVFYAFKAEPSPPAPIAASLTLLGTYPIMQQGQTASAIIVNRSLANHAHSFVLTVTRQAGNPVTLASIRPTLSVPTPTALQSADAVALLHESTGAPKPAPSRLNIDPESRRTAYRDVVLGFGEQLQANQIPVVSIASYVAKLTTDTLTTKDGASGKTADTQLTVSSDSRKLVDEAKYPQVRPLYRFNYTTGALVSFLRDPTFTKVKATIDDSATLDKTEPTTYKIEEKHGEARLLPAFLFSVYLWRIDAQEPFYKREGGWFAPTIGFSLTDPTDNFFAGWTTEVYESTQLFVGANWGKVKRLNFERDIDELTTDKAPATRTTRGVGLSLGVTFNINLIKTIFS